MERKTTLDDIVKWLTDRAFNVYNQDVDIESFKKTFIGIPNEACHLLDCQTLEVHLVHDNFAEVLGIPGFQPKMMVDLLSLIHEDHMELAMSFVIVTMAFESAFECGRDSVYQVYKLCNGKMILKTSTPLQMDSKRHVILVAEQYKDVTDLVNEKYKWNFTGPNSSKICQMVQNVLEKELPITAQEVTVLSLIGKGYSSKEAAEVLFLSKHTVDTHRRNILKKLNVNNTSEALKQMVDLGVLA